MSKHIYPLKLFVGLLTRVYKALLLRRVLPSQISPMTDFHHRTHHPRIQRRLPSGVLTRFPCSSLQVSSPLQSHKSYVFNYQFHAYDSTAFDVCQQLIIAFHISKNIINHFMNNNVYDILYVNILEESV